MKFTLKTLFVIVGLVGATIVALDHSTRNSRWRITRAMTTVGVSQLHFHSSFDNDLVSLELGDRLQRRGLARFGRLLSIDGCSLENPDRDLAYIDDVAVGKLSLNGTSLTDVGIAHIVRMPKVLILDLSDTAITDGALDQLVSLKSLSVIYLGGTAVTDSGIENFKSICPKVFVGRN